MKKLLILIISVFGICANAQKADFPAYVEKNILHVFVDSDTCNQVITSFTVAPSCRDDRASKNKAPICLATFAASSTRMFCQDSKIITKEFLFDLKKEHVADKARMLIIYWLNSTAEVQIKK